MRPKYPQNKIKIFPNNTKNETGFKKMKCSKTYSQKKGAPPNEPKMFEKFSIFKCDNIQET